VSGFLLVTRRVNSQCLASFWSLTEESLFFSHAVSLDQKFLNWVTNKDHATTMMTALEKGLDRVGYVTYDANCAKPCTSGETNQGRFPNDERPNEKEELLWRDTCEPVGTTCGLCAGPFNHVDVY
jgi:hypothetical protein